MDTMDVLFSGSGGGAGGGGGRRRNRIGRGGLISGRVTGRSPGAQIARRRLAANLRRR